MAAYEIPNLRFSGEAGGTIARRRFIKVNASEQFIQAAAGDLAIGVSTTDATTGQVVEVYDGIVIVEAGAAVNPQASIASDANGKAITWASGSVLGVALTKANAAGEFIAVKLTV